jgi:hypothetical protein
MSNLITILDEEIEKSENTTYAQFWWKSYKEWYIHWLKNAKKVAMDCAESIPLQGNEKTPMSNLIDRDEVMKIIYECTEEYELHTMKNRILSLPLQQQWGNEKIKELIEKKIIENDWSMDDYLIGRVDLCKELLSDFNSNN